ncbi:site-2 protease family protein [Candidatus Woesearchaeota archaeon]|nr:site-2 protease family protein [Candidatus Woesearchaeota archaeon]
MKDGIKIFSILGIDVKLHYSWWFIFILLSWSLSASFFPLYFPGYSTGTYWLMGIAASLLLFISVLLHELSHSLMARIRKIKVKSITLFFFGGVAGIDTEDLKPSSEFLMAISGPLFSLILGGMFYLIYLSDGQGVITAIAFYLYQLNLILALFNLVPGYPLDGGRAFRAVLYAYYKDLVKATAIASQVGKIFAGFLIIFGFIGIFTGSGGGLWFMLIGGFLYFIAGLSYQQVVAKSILEKIKVKDIMKTRIIALNPEMMLSEFIKKYADYEDNLFLIKNNQVQGIIDVDLLAPIKPEYQSKTPLIKLALPLRNIPAVDKNASAYRALQLLSGCGANAIPVLDKNKVAGIITQRILLNRMAWELKFRGGQLRKSRINH